jgi:hypothetical protein
VSSIAYIDISQENISSLVILELPGAGNCSIMAMTMGHSVVDDSPTETLYIIAMNIYSSTTWDTALLYVSNPRTNQVKLAARLTAPAGYRFWPNSGLAYDSKRHVLWYSAAPLSDGPNQLTQVFAAIDVRSGSAFIPFPNMVCSEICFRLRTILTTLFNFQTSLLGETYSYVGFVHNTSVTGDYLFVDWGYKMSVINLQNGAMMNSLVYAESCYGLSGWYGAVDWSSTTVGNTLKCSTFWVSGICRAKETIVRSVYICAGFAYKGDKIPSYRSLNILAALASN